MPGIRIAPPAAAPEGAAPSPPPPTEAPSAESLPPVQSDPASRPADAAAPAPSLLPVPGRDALAQAPAIEPALALHLPPPGPAPADAAQEVEGAAADGGAAGGEAAATRSAMIEIEQIGDRDLRPAYVPQLARPASAGALPGLAYAADVAQLPGPPELTREQRAALLAEAPTQLSLVVDGRRLGDVQIRTTGEGGFEIQLAGLLDMLADRFDAGEYAAMRAAAAADMFVTVDQLRSAGVNLRYDPAYDELTLSA